MPNVNREVPLFPLNTVLFPNGDLYLRIFEPRYLSMISEQLKSDSAFGVVLIREGVEAGAPATFHEIGTLAKIIDFDQLESGLLGISCKGRDRFRVISSRVREDGLALGEIEPMPDAIERQDAMQLVARYQGIAGFLRRSLSQTQTDEATPNWDDCSWISFQAAEMLPFSSDSRQQLLEMDTADRLFELNQVLENNNILGEGNPG